MVRIKLARFGQPLNRRTGAARALLQWREQVISDCGGLESLSAAKLALIDSASRTKAIVDAVDAFLLSQSSIVSKKRRALLPIVMQRQTLCDSLARLLNQLGLNRIPRKVKPLSERLQKNPRCERRVRAMFNRKRLSFAAFCRDVLGEPISPAWIVAYKAFDGESLTGDEMETWRTLTGRDSYEPNAARELVAVKGRRAQGTKTACKYLAYAIHTSAFRQFAAKSDRLHVPIIAQSRDVAGEIMSYLTAFYQETELRSEVEEILKASIRLRNGFVISTQTCSYRAPRGITAPLALLDEVGVWRIEGSDIDKEVLRSLTPAMVQFPNRKLIVLGSPWVKAGVLYRRMAAPRENHRQASRNPRADSNVYAIPAFPLRSLPASRQPIR